jgi:radical SAM superfamily enzyme YgiQ (UPF0313 family)
MGHFILLRPPALTTLLKPSTVVAPPIGVAYLASALREAGERVTVVDAVGMSPDTISPLKACGYRSGVAIGLKPEDIVAAIPEDATVLGVSCMFSSSWPYDRYIIEQIAIRRPGLRIIVGGEHASACWEYILDSTPCVAACAIGEGEETIIALAQSTDWSDVDGLALRDENGKPYRTGRRARIRDIDAIELPAWDLLPLESYLAGGLNHGTTRRRSMPLLATRGCPYSCSFCSSPQMWTTRWKARDPVQLVAEMAEYKRQWNVTNFDLYDLTTIVDRRWTVAFARELIDQGLSITYQLASGSRTEAIDSEVAELLARSGCTHITFAPETGSEEAIKRHRKKIDLDRMEAALRACRAHGIVVSLNFILFPDDAIADVLATWRFALRCATAGAADVSYFPYLPYPGSALYDELLQTERLPPLSDQFLAELLAQFDLVSSHSHNPRFSDTAMRGLRTMVIGSFLAVAAAHDPRRTLHAVGNVITGKPNTRLEKATSDIIRRVTSTLWA